MYIILCEETRVVEGISPAAFGITAGGWVVSDLISGKFAIEWLAESATLLSSWKHKENKKSIKLTLDQKKDKRFLGKDLMCTIYQIDVA